MPFAPLRFAPNRGDRAFRPQSNSTSGSARAVRRRYGHTVHDTKIARQNQVQIPAEICLRCFNQQQQLGFPFLVYCGHHEMLALFHSPREYVTFVCAPEQLEGVLHMLQKESARRADASLGS